MSELTLLYIPVPSQEVGRQLSAQVIPEGLAACANLHGPVSSYYEWEDVFREETEWVLVLKTTADQVERLRHRIEELHPYDCPCILSWKAEANPAFATWAQGIL